MKEPHNRSGAYRRGRQALLLLGLFAGAASAENSWYGSLSGGFAALEDTGLGGSFSGTSNATFDTGFGAGGAVGYEFDNNWRIEGEFMYRSNDIDRLDLVGAPAGTSGGDFSSLGIGINVYRDFDLGGNPDSRGYLGLGLVQLQEIDMDFVTPTGEASYSDSGSGFQVMLGARYRLDRPWYLFSELRYFDAGSVKLDGEGGAAGQVTADYAVTSLMVGLGYRFR